LLSSVGDRATPNVGGRRKTHRQLTLEVSTCR